MARNKNERLPPGLEKKVKKIVSAVRFELTRKDYDLNVALRDGRQRLAPQGTADWNSRAAASRNMASVSAPQTQQQQTSRQPSPVRCSSQSSSATAEGPARRWGSSLQCHGGQRAGRRSFDVPLLHVRRMHGSVIGGREGAQLMRGVPGLLQPASRADSSGQRAMYPSATITVRAACRSLAARGPQPARGVLKPARESCLACSVRVAAAAAGQDDATYPSATVTASVGS